MGKQKVEEFITDDPPRMKITVTADFAGGRVTPSIDFNGPDDLIKFVTVTLKPVSEQLGVQIEARLVRDRSREARPL